MIRDPLSRGRVRTGGLFLLLWGIATLLLTCTAGEQSNILLHSPDRPRQGVDGALTAPWTTPVKPAGAPGTRATGVVGMPFDVSAVVRQVHFAYSPAAGGAHRSGHSTYGVKVTRSGRTLITPIHHPLAARGPASGTPASQAAAPWNGAYPPPNPPASPLRGRAMGLETVDLPGESCAAVRSVEVDRDGSLLLRRGAVLERLRNSERGVQQSWRFARRPPASESLTVRVRVSGLRHLGTTRAGLHFVDPRSGLGFVYGPATWIDARGQNTPVAARFRRGHLELRLPADLVRRSAFPAVLDPLISPEFGVDKPLSGPAWASQTRPSVATDGTGYLVVWQDYRNLKTASWDIHGARVSAAGVLQDSSGFLISAAPGHQQVPRVAHGKGTYLVVWQDHRNNATYPDIYGARVSPAGVLQETQGLAISTAASYQYYPSVTFGAANFLVVWQDHRKGAHADIFGARVSPAGVLQDTSGISISMASGHQTGPSVTHGAGQFLVVWTDYRKSSSYPDVYGARLTPNGALLDASGIPISVAAYHQSAPAAAFSGTDYLVVWQDYRSYTKSAWDIYGARVATSGNVQDSSGIPISTAVSHQTAPAVAHDGSGYLVAWQDQRTSSTTASDIYGARLSNAGVLQDKNGIGISYAVGHQQYPAVAARAGAFLAVWEDQRNSASVRSDIYGARIQASGAVVDPAGLLISAAANNQLAPAIAHDGTNYLVVWQDFRNYQISSNDIYGALVSPSGTLLAGMAVAQASGDQLTPAVAFGGSRYLVVWQQGGDIYGAQVDSSGKLIHPTGVPLSTAANNQLNPAVAYGGGSYLVVWQDHRKSASVADIYGVRVNNYGGLMDAQALGICTAPADQQYPAMVFDGTNHFVVWQDARTASSSSWDIHGARVSAAGKLLDSVSIAVSAQLANQQRPAVALGPGGYLVVWQDDRSKPNSSWDIHGARVSTAGILLDSTGFAISSASSDELTPSVAHGGSDYLVVWQDLRNGKNNPDIYGTQVSAGATVHSPLGVAFSTSWAAELPPALASAGKQSHLLVYTRYAPNSPLGAYRVQGRVITPAAANGASCSSPKQCHSGFCVDGVCCDKACGMGSSGADCQACSVAQGAAKDGVCGPVKAGRVCRPAAGPCDAAESCDGLTSGCPVDALATAGTICRGALGVCDVAESCSGSSGQCPADQHRPSTAVCRAQAGACDLAEQCDGSAAHCPPDKHQPAGTQCRAQAGICDVAESCSGSAASCPVDSHAPATTVCRQAAGICDVAESCSGASALCPGDLFKLPGAICRAAAGSCDLAESCSGAAAGCAADTFKKDGTSCAQGICKAGKCQAADLGTPDRGPDRGPDLAAPDSAPDRGVDVITPAAETSADSPGPEGGAAGDLAAPAQCKEGCSCELGAADPGGIALPLLLLLWIRRGSGRGRSAPARR